MRSWAIPCQVREKAQIAFSMATEFQARASKLYAMECLSVASREGLCDSLGAESMWRDRLSGDVVRRMSHPRAAAQSRKSARRARQDCEASTAHAHRQEGGGAWRENLGPRAEAGLDPDANVRHTEPKLAQEEDVGVTKVRSEGLLQLAMPTSSDMAVRSTRQRTEG